MLGVFNCIIKSYCFKNSLRKNNVKQIFNNVLKTAWERAEGVQGIFLILYYKYIVIKQSFRKINVKQIIYNVLKTTSE